MNLILLLFPFFLIGCCNGEVDSYITEKSNNETRKVSKIIRIIYEDTFVTNMIFGKGLLIFPNGKDKYYKLVALKARTQRKPRSNV